MPKLPEGVLTKMATTAAALIVWLLVLVVLNRELIGLPGWFEGVACGIAVAWAWTRSGTFRLLAGAVGTFALMAILVGDVSALGLNARALFQGMSLGIAAGLLCVAAMDRRRMHAWLLRTCEAFDDQAGIDWLHRHTPPQ